MSNVIIVAHPKTGLLFTPTSNPEWVKCQVKQTGIKVNGGVISTANKVAFPLLSSKVADLLAANGLKNGSVLPIEGKIVHKRSRVPFYDGQNPVVNPSTGEAIMFEGAIYYQEYTFTSDLTEADKQNTFVGTAANVSVKTEF